METMLRVLDDPAVKRNQKTSAVGRIYSLNKLGLTKLLEVSQQDSVLGKMARELLPRLWALKARTPR